MKIIQIAAAETSDPQDGDIWGTIYALADDGSVWMMVNPWAYHTAHWKKLPDIGEESE
jgi:hypothetical protein